MSYIELSIEERASTQVGQAQGLSLRRIARFLGRAPYTISCEIRRHQMAQDSYCARHAQQQRATCRSKRKLMPGTERFDLIIHMVRRRLSSEQISGKLQAMKLLDLRDAYVCHEAIYIATYALPVGHLRKRAASLLSTRKNYP